MLATTSESHFPDVEESSLARDSQEPISSASNKRKLEHEDSQGPISSTSKRKLSHKGYAYEA